MKILTSMSKAMGAFSDSQSLLGSSTGPLYQLKLFAIGSVHRACANEHLACKYIANLLKANKLERRTSY